ncbi:MAG: PKD domain-containing protein, partial [Catalinimonas sp.]
CGSVDMVENYMDYTNDQCMNIFTADQVARMRTVLELSPRRRELSTSPALAPEPVAPLANFSAPSTVIYAGSSLEFVDQSVGSRTWNWTFEGGTPGTTTAFSPTVTYDAPGLYDVQLIVGNDFGVDTLLRTDYVQVLAVAPCDTFASVTNAPLTLYSDPDGGYVSGHNANLDQAKAEAFEPPPGGSALTGMTMRFGRVANSRGTSQGQVALWADEGGAPAATPFFTTSFRLLEARIDVLLDRPTTVLFDTLIRPTGTFYAGVLLDYGQPGDTVALRTTEDDGEGVSTAWEQLADGTWLPYDTAEGRDLAVSHAVALLTSEQPPSADFVADVTEICAAQAVRFSVPAPSGGTSFRWEFPGGLPATSSQASPTVVYREEGSYDVRLTVVGECGGSITKEQTAVVTVRAAASIELTTEALTICQGGSVLATAAGADAYEWSIAAGPSVGSGESLRLAPDTTTTYVVTGFDATGCPARKSFTVEVTPNPTVVQTSGTTTVCPGESIDLVVAGAESYVWLPAEGLTATDGATATVTPPSTTTYSVVGTSGNACGDTLNITVEVLPTPTAAFTPASDTVAIGQALSFTNASTAAETYAWDFGDGQTADDETPSVTYTTPGTYVVRLVARNGDCNDTTTATVIVEQVVSAAGALQRSVRVFPNPTRTTARVEADGARVETVRLLTITGVELRRTPRAEVPVTDIAAGLYVLEVRTDRGVTYHRLRVE